MSKYAVRLEENRYVKNCAMISDTTVVVTLTVDKLENATLFDEDLEDVFKRVYPKAESIPVDVVSHETKES